MPHFSYKGRNTRGELVQGRLEGNDTGAVAEQLFSVGITPVEINRAGAESGPNEASEWLKQLTAPKVGLLDVMLFSRQMHTLLKAGVPILRALAGLEESAINPSLVAVIKDLRTGLDAGRELSAAMRRHPEVFSNFYVSIVRVGELTGGLDAVFLRLYQHLEFEKEIRERIKAALRYPSFVVIAMVGALIVINLFVIPAFAKVFAGFKAELPLMTRILIGFSNFMTTQWPILLGALILAVILTRGYVRTPVGRYQWDRYKLRLPVAGKIILKATLARFARTFALALQSGVPAVQALSTVAQVVDNDYLGQRIMHMRDGVERGESVLRTAANAGIFTPVVLQMIAVGDETGELDSLLSEVAELYEREVEYEVRTLSAQIEPILLIVLGAMVLVLALGVFLPMWELGRAASGRA
jgi:MSHA biogenesis protein MshG